MTFSIFNKRLLTKRGLSQNKNEYFTIGFRHIEPESFFFTQQKLKNANNKNIK